MSSSDTNSSSPCWQFEDNHIHQGIDWLPCGPWTSSGPVLSCCKYNDYCMSNGICHYTHSRDGGSGYYQGSCTDSDYENGLCPHLCNDQLYPDVTYNTNLNEWQCCGTSTDGDVSCNAPTTNEYFMAPAPSALTTTASAGQTTLPSSISSAHTSSGATSAASNTSTATAASASVTGHASAGLSTGAIAGIAIGVVILGLIAVGALIYFLLRKRKQRRAATAPVELNANQYHQLADLTGGHKHEHLGQGHQQLTEADSGQVHEMGGPERKMYYDYQKGRWLYETSKMPEAGRQPSEMSADQITSPQPFHRQPTELSAESRPVEMDVYPR